MSFFNIDLNLNNNNYKSIMATLEDRKKLKVLEESLKMKHITKKSFEKLLDTQSSIFNKNEFKTQSDFHPSGSEEDIEKRINLINKDIFLINKDIEYFRKRIKLMKSVFIKEVNVKFIQSLLKDMILSNENDVNQKTNNQELEKVKKDKENQVKLIENEINKIKIEIEYNKWENSNEPNKLFFLEL